MQLARPLSLPKRRPRHAQAIPSAPATNLARERNKRANVSEDAATYSCGCGYVFTAPVSTSVDCPHCGGQQAWQVATADHQAWQAATADLQAWQAAAADRRPPWVATADLTVIVLGRSDASAPAYIAEIQRTPARQDRVEQGLVRRLLD